jgi:hypothetical protein
VLCVQVPDDVYDSELSRFHGMLDALRAAGESRAAQELENDSPLKHVVSMAGGTSISTVGHSAGTVGCLRRQIPRLQLWQGCSA